MPINKSCFREKCNTTHDLLPLVSGGSMTSDRAFTPLLSCVCNLFWDQIQPDKCTENDGLTGSHRLTEIHGHFLFSRFLSSSRRVQRWISIQCWDQGKVMTELMYWWCTPTAPPFICLTSVGFDSYLLRKSSFKRSETNSFSFANLSSYIYENVPRCQTSFTNTVVLGAAGFVLNQACVSKRYSWGFSAADLSKDI